MGIIVITGESSGMGFEMALQLDRIFQKTDEFWLIGRNENKLLSLKSKLRNNAKIFAMDLSKDYSFEQFKDILSITKPHIQILVNAAGFGLIGNSDTLPYDAEADMIRVNCEALTKMTSLCVPYMKKNSRIIEFASCAAFMPQPGFAVYAASKAYVHSYSLAIAEELRSRGIYVTSVCPGPVSTAFFERAEKYGNILSAKKFFMSMPQDVVAKAIRDSYHKKTISTYSLAVKSLKVLTDYLPSGLLIKGMQLITKMD